MTAVIVICGCGRRAGRDVSTGPAARSAIKAAKDVAPGTMELTAFTAFDTGDLVGLEGRSYIAKLPRNAGENPRHYSGHQWYVNGEAKGELHYGPSWTDFYVERTRCWLIDVAIQRNYFAENPDLEALAFVRFKSLDASRRWGRHGPIRLKPPDEYEHKPDHRFQFRFNATHDLRVGADIPIGMWYVWTEESVRKADILEAARAAPAACVFFIRFQTDHPGAQTQ